jgi:NAD(P)H dehydrogenase (quinone)
MKILLVLAHPDPKSFNHTITQTVITRLKTNGHTLTFFDLYKEKFDPVLPAEEIPKNGEINQIIKQHCCELAKADGIIIVHPNWWGQPPAILKGWVDRVIRPGVAYEFMESDGGEGVPIGLLKAKTAIVFNTSNTSPEREENIFLDPLETIWKNCIFGLCGIKTFYRKIFRIVVTSTNEQRLGWLAETEETIDRFFPHKI